MIQARVAFVPPARLVAHPAVVPTPVVLPTLAVLPILVVLLIRAVHRAGAPRMVVQQAEAVPVNRLLVEAAHHGGEVEVPVLALALVLVRARVPGPQAAELHRAARVRIMVAPHLAVRDLQVVERLRVVWASESTLLSTTAHNCIIFNPDFLYIGTNLGHYVKGHIYLVFWQEY